MNDPLSQIEIKSQYISAIRLSFEIEVEEDIIFIKFSDLPNEGQPWYGYHKSEKYGSGCYPLNNVAGGINASPIQISESLCNVIKAGKPKNIRNIQKNYVDLNIPHFIKQSLVSLNYPEQISNVERLNGCVLFADLREFSNWSLAAEPEQINEVYEVISERIVQMAQDYPYDYWKLLGDGVMLVWHCNHSISDTVDFAIAAAFELHKKYWYYQKDSSFKVPSGFGIAICGGYFSKHTSRTYYERVLLKDYIGPIVNMAARLQTVAQPGEVFVNRFIQKNSKYKDYTFNQISEELQKEIISKKGFSQNESDIYKVSNKYFNNNWSNYITLK
ncbi:MAG: adenylate/guanylate cyclase domain-containing protein [Bacteroidota bacterium]